MNERPDHTHECRSCRGSIPCGTPNDECNDHPGDCEFCSAAFEAGRAKGRSLNPGRPREGAASYPTAAERQQFVEGWRVGQAGAKRRTIA